MTTTDWIAVGGLLLALSIYLLQLTASRNRDMDGVLALLEGVKSATEAWGDAFFEHGYNEQSAKERAEIDFNLVQNHRFGQVYRPPTAPLTALIEHPAGVREQTMKAASDALYWLGVFNQYVQQQTDFNTLHLAEFIDKKLPGERRSVLAEAARAQSLLLHGQGIGDAGWYGKLKAELDMNIKLLQEQRKWWGWARLWRR